MFTVIGIERKIGEYQGFTYDNTIFHVTYPISSKKGEGLATTTFKIKSALLDSVPELNTEVEPLFDRYRNCIAIKFKE